jgi:hypothetical protein
MKRIKISHLCGKNYWTRKMSRCRFEYAKAVAARPDVEMLFTGPGFEGYDGDASVGENLKRMGFEPQVAWGYKCHEMSGFADLKAMKVCCYNESWWPDNRAANECIEQEINLIVCHHYNDIPRFDLASVNADVIHIPHAANPVIFRGDVKTVNRPFGCLLTGAIDKDIYPLRWNMDRAILMGNLPGSKIRRHPGYRLQSEAACDQQFADYALALKSVKVSLCCTSKYRYFLAKIVESIMAGCIVVTDWPDDPEFDEYLAEHCVLVDSKAAPAEIVDRINSELPGLWGKCEKEHQMQAAGQAAALKHFSTERYAARFIKAVRERL